VFTLDHVDVVSRLDLLNNCTVVRYFRLWISQLDSVGQTLICVGRIFKHISNTLTSSCSLSFRFSSSCTYHLITIPVLPSTIFYCLSLLIPESILESRNSNVPEILSSIIFWFPQALESGLPSHIFDSDQTYWFVVFVLVSFIFLFCVYCTYQNVSFSDHVKLLASYRIVVTWSLYCS